MPRPFKHRFITGAPSVTLFKPAGVPARDLRVLTLPLDGFEALRLTDLEGLPQEETASRLGVSRPTVSRILQRARRVVARALSEGCALAIEGGPVIERRPHPGPGRFGRCGGLGRGGKGGPGRRGFRGGRP